MSIAAHFLIVTMAKKESRRPVIDARNLTGIYKLGDKEVKGSVSVRGSMKGSPITGHGYVELTGYAKAFDAL